ncbi:hypothetical protein [Sphingomonas sp. SRS2]|uniref:hypothetical protein n=1 Tax=Sphingomonas sp. SRS2 TaxID=133190 RepID=UPI0006184A96|nr:hypothetical protein [Sphingomonas sp. SRS2]KKC24837.1 hypothetical protein WP12_16490 [Sphingomonas sp. SRS2]
MLVRCSNSQCGRARIFDVRAIRDHWKKKRWSDRFRDVPLHFYCAICRSRPERLQWIEPGPYGLGSTIKAPAACLAPFGINPLAWALASPEDRERLIKARR